MPLKSAKRSGVSIAGFVLALPRLAQQVVDQRLRVDFFLDVERRGVDDEVAPVLLVLPAPDELGIEVACCADLSASGGCSCSFWSTDLILGGRDVLPLGLVVREVRRSSTATLASREFSGHHHIDLSCAPPVA